MMLMNTAGVGTSALLRLPPAKEDEQGVSIPSHVGFPLAFVQKKILIVDDYLPNRVLLRHQLQYLGHQVFDAEQGEQALSLWRGGQNYDAMLIDCNMPGMDGFTLARRLRKEAQQQGKPPVLMLGFTADDRPEMVERCITAGMDGCLFKPTTLDELATWLQSEKRSAASSSPLLDKIAWLTGADPALIQTFLHQLAQSLQENRQHLQQALAQRQRQSLSDEVHKIKGLARLVHDDELHIQCIALELACQFSAWKTVVTLTQQLIDLLHRLDYATAAALLININKR